MLSPALQPAIRLRGTQARRRGGCSKKRSRVLTRRRACLIAYLFRFRYYADMSTVATQIPGYLSIPEAAKELGITDSLVRRYVREGRLPRVMVGKKTQLIPKSNLKSFASIARRRGPKKSS